MIQKTNNNKQWQTSQWNERTYYEMEYLDFKLE